MQPPFLPTVSALAAVPRRAWRQRLVGKEGSAGSYPVPTPIICDASRLPWVGVMVIMSLDL